MLIGKDAKIYIAYAEYRIFFYRLLYGIQKKKRRVSYEAMSLS